MKNSQENNLKLQIKGILEGETQSMLNIIRGAAD